MIAQRRSKLSDPDMQAVPAALARAAKSARELAKKTATSLVIAHDGLVMLKAFQLACSAASRWCCVRQNRGKMRGHSFWGVRVIRNAKALASYAESATKTKGLRVVPEAQRRPGSPDPKTGATPAQRC